MKKHILAVTSAMVLTSRIVGIILLLKRADCFFIKQRSMGWII